MATSKNFKIPPALDPDTSYESWKNEIAIWKLVCELDKKKQALAVTLSLSGKARQKALEIPVADLNKDDGIDTLITALDQIFLQDKVDLAYSTYSKFDTFKKSASISMSDYIIEYERLYHQCTKHGMTMPDAVLAFKLLDNSNLSPTERQLALTAANDLKFETMKGALRRIFANNPTSDTGKSIDVQSAYYTSYKKKTNNTRYSPDNRQTKNSSSKLNPLNKFGKTARCVICQSVYHWKRDCPHKAEQAHLTDQCNEEPEVEECHLALFTKSATPSAYEIFTVESFGAAILDTACSKTVCGQKWFENYMSNLSQDDKNKVSSTSSSKLFKFGDGETVRSMKLVNIPCKIGNVNCTIDTEVVPTDIPMLLSKSSLQRAGTILNLKEDRAEMLNQDIKLELTSSGHYCVNILKDEYNEDNIMEHEALIIDEHMSTKETKTLMEKLHKQFGHATADRMKRLLTSAGQHVSSKVSDILQEVIGKCTTCLMHKQTPPKPAVCMPLASDFNQTVAVDLHELQPNLWYLHIIDIFTRFSAGCILKTKQSSEFVNQFLRCWISIHGAPSTLFSDNGGEFNSEIVRDMAANFNIEIKTTAAYSPFSNGILERHNKTLTEILLKVKYDTDCDWNSALSWALMAKNAMVSNLGFSPYQLVFGRNPNLPNVLQDRPPALEGVTNSQIVGNHIMAMYSARKAFTEAECSSRIRRAIRRQIKPTGKQFQTGDKVYYKKTDSPLWKGPGTVIGQDSVVVFIRHGGTYVRVHSSRIRKVNEEEIKDDSNVAIPQKENDTQTQNDNHVDFEEQTDPHVENDPAGQDNDNDNPAGQEINEDLHDNENEQLPNIGQRELPEPIDMVDATKLKSGEILTFTNRDSGEQSICRILGRASRATGKLKSWYNIEFVEPDAKAGEKISIDMSTVEIDKQEQFQNNDQLEDVLVVNDGSFHNAKKIELESWIKNSVYEEVPDVGQKCISTRWVCTLKETPDGVTPKARLVARGFEDFHNKDIPKDSPTCAIESLRTVLAVVSQKRWSIHTMDIKTAFLQGAELSRTIYLRPPSEAHTQGTVWKLQKCVYGLADASLFWYKRVCQVMSDTGANVSLVEPAVFYWVDSDGQIQGILACHVDDFIWGGTQHFKNTVIPQIRKAFLVGREEEDTFSYVGIEIKQIHGEIHLTQNKYVESIKMIQIDKSRQVQKTDNLTPSETEQLRSKIGQLLWVARQSRPDILFDVCSLTSNLKDAKVKHILDANKVIKRVKSETVSLKYRHLKDNFPLKLVAFSDASLGNLKDGATQGGNFIVLMGNDGHFSPLSWQSKRIRRVVRSTLAGETLALTESLDTAIFLATLYSELSTGIADSKSIPITCVVDNKSLCEAVRSTKHVTERRLRLEISHIKELVNTNQIQQLKWSDTKHQLADCLTKGGASPIELLKAMENGLFDIEA